MASFLKKILEPSEHDAFDHLTWMETPYINIFEGLCSEDVLPLANVGLPGPLIPRQHPRPAYVTHTGPLVLQQDRLGRAPPARPADTEPRGEPRDAGAEKQDLAWSRGGSTAGTEEDSVGIPKEKSNLTPPSVCHMIIFARKPPSTVLPQSNLACSSKRERPGCGWKQRKARRCS